MNNFIFEYRRSDSTIYRFIVNELYIYGLASILSYCLGYGVTKMICHLLKPKSNQTQIGRGGDLNAEALIAANALIACVADNENYLVKDSHLVKEIFSMLKENPHVTSLIIKPTLIRLIASHIVKRAEHNPVLKIQNLLVYVPKTAAQAVYGIMGIFLTGVGGARAGIGIIANGVSVLFSFITLVILISQCQYDCRDYVHQLPHSLESEPLEIYSHAEQGHLIITEKAPDSVSVYVPTYNNLDKSVTITVDPTRCDTQTNINIKTPGNLRTPVSVETSAPDSCISVQSKPSFRRVRPKAKQVNFSDFKKVDPILSQYQDVTEFSVPQKKCLPDAISNRSNKQESRKSQTMDSHINTDNDNNWKKDYMDHAYNLDE